jgi:hypothetical protein
VLNHPLRWWNQMSISVHGRKWGNLQQDPALPRSWCRTAFVRARAAFLRGPDSHPPGPGRPSSGARTAFLRGPDGLPPGPGRPSFRSRAVFLQAKAVFLQLQDRLPPWPGRPIRERIQMSFERRSSARKLHGSAHARQGSGRSRLPDKTPCPPFKRKSWPARPRRSISTDFRARE